MALEDDLQHPVFSRVFARLVTCLDRHGGSARRRALLTGLTGRVLEVGAGAGSNFAHYPPTVTEVIAVEPDHHLRGLAIKASQQAPVLVHVAAGHADDLPGRDGEFDAVVMCLVLCSVPDQASALAEARRILRSGGQLRYYEHVRSGRAPVSAFQDLITPLWSRVAGGCHLNRDTAAALEAAGFHQDTHEPHALTRHPLAPGLGHILGTARHH